MCLHLLNALGTDPVNDTPGWHSLNAEACRRPVLVAMKVAMPMLLRTLAVVRFKFEQRAPMHERSE